MGSILAELYIERIIKEGLRDLRDQPSKIDMLFDRFMLGSLKTQYGQKPIDEIKEYLLSKDKKISVVQAWPLIGQKLPCYSILVTGTEEDTAHAFFGDYEGIDNQEYQPDALATFIVSAYDPITGLVTVSAPIDVTKVYLGAIFVDNSGHRFEITGPILDTKFGIATEADVALGEGAIVPSINWRSTTRFATPLIDHIQIGVHAAENTNLCKYMYYMLLYFLQSKRMEMENLSLQLHTFTVTEFTKILDYLPDNVLTRFLNLRMMSWFSWSTDPYDGIAGIGNSNVKVLKDEWIKRGDFTVITTDGSEDLS